MTTTEQATKIRQNYEGFSSDRLRQVVDYNTRAMAGAPSNQDHVREALLVAEVAKEILRERGESLN